MAAAEIIESDIWLQYQERGGVQDDEVSKIASKQIPGYPAQPTGGSLLYTQALLPLDGDMPQYIHDNTEDEFTHETFINAFLVSKGASPVSLDQFGTLPSSNATGANQVGRLTTLTQLKVDTTWWTRYRSRTGNPDLGDTFPPAVPSLVVGTHPGIPRTDDDLNDANFLQAIANTAGFHFANIEVGGASMYPGLAQRVTSVEVNGVPIIDPVTKIPVLFPDLTNAAVPAVGEDLQSNLIMPEPTAFLSRKLPVWPWLLGPFITAYIRVNDESEAARNQAGKWLEPLQQHLSSAGLGHISEIFEGDFPNRPCGCIAQAWSVGEVLRAYTEEVKGIRPSSQPKVRGKSHKAGLPPRVTLARG